jgi:hypothetical protein
VQWAFRGWSYYFHDDDAVDRLLHTDFPEFPHLKIVVDHCITSLNVKHQLWRHLVLWVYGGVYADLNLYPTNFNKTTIRPTDDGFFLTDPKTTRLSADVLAVSPRHPLMYYAVQRAISNILRAGNIGLIDPQKITGQDNLSQALMDFHKTSDDQGKIEKLPDALSNGAIMIGHQNRSIRVAGAIDGPDEFVTPIFMSEAGKKKEFAKMGMMALSHELASTHSCFRDMMGAPYR